MTRARVQCASPTDDLGFFFDRGHGDLAARARDLAMNTFAAQELRQAGDSPVDHSTLEGRCRAIAIQLAGAGLLDVVMPTTHGGFATARPGDLDLRAVCVVSEMLAWGSPLAEFVFATQGLGSYPIVRAGSDSQKQEFLPGVRSGRSLGAFAITEQDAGSDVAAMKTVARREGEHYVLDGEKTLIANAGLADHYVVFAKTEPALGRRGITAFLVRPQDPGFEFLGAIQLLAEQPIGTIRFTSVRLPASRRLGAEGAGMRLAMTSLDAFRAIAGAAALGLARRALDETLSRVRSREQFGSALAGFQTTQVYVADMATELDAARLLVYRAAHAHDAGADRVTLEASMAKMFATEAAQRIVDRGVQLHGGSGLVRGHVLERLYREVRSLRISEGTTEIQQVVIAEALLAAEKARADEALSLTALRETLPPPSLSVPTRAPLIPSNPTTRIAAETGSPDATRQVQALRFDKPPGRKGSK